MPNSIATDFTQLNLIEPIQRALQDEGYRRPTPIQARAIPHVLAGRDLLGCAQTGTGKTAAFALPILQLLSLPPKAVAETSSAHARRGSRPIRCLVLSPTRELAAQIGASVEAYGRHTGLRHTVIFGGVGQGSQATALHRGVDIVVATPGRLCDLMGQNLVDLSRLEILVLDEADRMLDMGFLPDVRRIEQSCPRKRQTLFFSATLTPQVERVAWSFINDPIRIEVTPNATTVEAIEQRLFRVERQDKIDLLVHLLRDPAVDRTIVFTRTKHGADKVVRQLDRSGLRCMAIHGNKSQGQRERALEDFRDGRVHVLVATDIAARGLDIDHVTHVINFDMPVEPEAYVHRIGRTGRAEAAGVAISFCTPAEREELHAIEKLIRLEIPLTRAETVLRGARPAAAAVAQPDRHDRHDRPGRHDQAQRSSHAPRSDHRHSPPRHAADTRHEPRHRSRHDMRDNSHETVSRDAGPHRREDLSPGHPRGDRDSRHPRPERDSHPAGRDAQPFAGSPIRHGTRDNEPRDRRDSREHRGRRDHRDDGYGRNEHVRHDSRDSRSSVEQRPQRDLPTGQARPARAEYRPAASDHRSSGDRNDVPRDSDSQAAHNREANERRFHGGDRSNSRGRSRRGRR